LIAYFWFEFFLAVRKMGISWVLVYPTLDGKSPNQALDDLGKQLLNQGFEKDQAYTVECETYFPIQNALNPKTFHVICDSDRPASCFLVSDKDQTLSITVERSMMGFLGKLSKAYSTKKATNIEVKGTSYVYHDFVVRAGVLTYANIVRGIILEAELRSCPVLITAVELMREFVNTILPVPMDTSPQFFTQRPAILGAMYSPLDTILQYFDIFSNVRKNSQMMQK
jgi:mediator of RNA polymerase II transcription subunit 20